MFTRFSGIPFILASMTLISGEVKHNWPLWFSCSKRVLFRNRQLDVSESRPTAMTAATSLLRHRAAIEMVLQKTRNPLQASSYPLSE
jgi:hypothetical protein